ncbi:MAG: hypothetical protein AB7R90_19415 [Reyranellaceae bacterium]
MQAAADGHTAAGGRAPVAGRGLNPLPLRAAAKALTSAGYPISHSTLSRQVARGQIPNRGAADRPLVDVEEVIAARRDNIDPRLQRPPQAALPMPPAVNAEAPEKSDTVNSHRADHERIKARMAAIELEERLGNLVDRREVEDAFETLARELRDKLLAASDLLATDLAGIADVAVIRVKIEEANRKVLTELADSYRRLAVATEAEPARAD